MSEENQNNNRIEKWVYHTEGKNTCDVCNEHNGKEFKTLDEAPQLPIHSNCKCWLEPIEAEMCPICLAIDGYIADFSSIINEMQVFASSATAEITNTIALVEEKTKYA